MNSYQSNKKKMSSVFVMKLSPSVYHSVMKLSPSVYHSVMKLSHVRTRFLTLWNYDGCQPNFHWKKYRLKYEFISVKQKENVFCIVYTVIHIATYPIWMQTYRSLGIHRLSINSVTSWQNKAKFYRKHLWKILIKIFFNSLANLDFTVTNFVGECYFYYYY
jgi:hypothetical protein